MDHEHQGLLAPTPEFLASVKVFPLIPSLKKDVIRTIGNALSWEQLTASDINFTIVRPIVQKYARLKNMAVVYACLVVRQYFLSQSEGDLANAGVMQSRATLCEILAMKLLSRFASNHIQLVAVLTTRWNPLAGATSEIVEQVSQAVGGDEGDMDSAQSALEMAISTQAKAFLASPVSQNVVNDIYSGRIVFTLSANRSILADNYKPRAIELYDCRNAPFIDHYRLRVPFYGAMLEFLNFALLLIIFMLCLSNQDKTQITGWEMIFILFAGAFTLEEYTAATEHGWIIYIANVLWNVFDFSFVAIFLAYISLRIKGLSHNDIESSDLAFDILSCGACILFPRLVFFVISNNVVILSLRAMVSQFVFFIGIAAACFSGLLFTLWTLGKDEEPSPSLNSIAWLLTQIWFGNTSLSFADASHFHPVFGPVLMITFAAMSNTLLLTILISLLSNTVARIDANATQEYLFQFAILTMDGVKSDALFSYQPPFNVLAFLILKPATFILSPRALHTTNVFLIKLTSLPTLILIGLYERYFAAGQRFAETGREAAHSLFNSLPRHIKHMPLVEALIGSSSSDIYEAIFDVDLTSELDPFEDSDDEVPNLRSFHSRESVGGGGVPLTPRRRKRVVSSVGPSSPRDLSFNLPSPEPLPSADLPVQPSTSRSPLAMLFGSRMPLSDGQTVASRTEAAVRRVEAMMEDIRDLPVQKLKDEMKDLQDRQARIENLLLVLTRGMRETPYRHDDSQKIFPGVEEALATVWSIAKKENFDDLFELRKVERDNPPIDVVIPDTFLVLKNPTNALFPFDTAALITMEYVQILKDVISFYIDPYAGHADQASETGNDEGPMDVDEPDENQLLLNIVEKNPFKNNPSLQQRRQASGFILLGNPGIGKTVWLKFLLVLRLLARQPTIFQDRPQHFLFFDGERVFSRDCEGDSFAALYLINSGQIPKYTWCLIDTNDALTTIPQSIHDLQLFIVQSSSPHSQRLHWLNKTQFTYMKYYMKPWTLSELILGRTLQPRILSEANIEGFYNKYGPFPRQVYGYARAPSRYEEGLLGKIDQMTLKKLQRLFAETINTTHSHDVSHPLILISPTEVRSKPTLSIPTCHLFQLLRGVFVDCLLENSALLYDAFLENPRTRAPAGYLLEEKMHLLCGGGEWEIVPLERSRHAGPKNHHWKTPEESPKPQYLYLGREEAHISINDEQLPAQATYKTLKLINYLGGVLLDLQDAYYRPLRGNEATYDTSIYDRATKTATIFQATVSEQLSVKEKGLAWLQSLGVKRFRYIAVTPPGSKIDLPFPKRYVPFVGEVIAIAAENEISSDHENHKNRAMASSQRHSGSLKA
ncbi:hypothetical protein D9615_004249 [Tricholomella constricta]|uniref:Uncharacterized protein n=1 Tax=Tricholomella constricta TaxID=117010 RepID=A0A8H5HEV0_9AGAR|nr:hypothetical protein D9615_004249 [Tricholomella constricta]